MDVEKLSDNLWGAGAYSFGWISGTYVFLYGIEMRAARWHGLQSMIVFGGLMMSMIVVDEILTLSKSTHDLIMGALLFVSVALWILLPVLTLLGKPFVVPVFAPLTKKIAGEPPWTQQSTSEGLFDRLDFSTGPGPNWTQGDSSIANSMPCSQCGATGQMTCSTCGGRGSWYEQPTTATGSAQLRSCGACTASGHIRCMSCGGTGRHRL